MQAVSNIDWLKRFEGMKTFKYIKVLSYNEMWWKANAKPFFFFFFISIHAHRRYWAAFFHVAFSKESPSSALQSSLCLFFSSSLQSQVELEVIYHIHIFAILWQQTGRSKGRDIFYVSRLHAKHKRVFCRRTEGFARLAPTLRASTFRVTLALHERRFEWAFITHLNFNECYGDIIEPNGVGPSSILQPLLTGNSKWP